MNSPVQVQEPQQASARRIVNGVDVDTLLGTVNAIAADGGLGACRFRATNTWLHGSHNRSTVVDFHGARQDIPHRQAFTMDADEPAILAGNDHGANPVEHLLHALASCLTTSMVAHAAVRGIRIDEMESTLEGDLDLRGFLGLAADVPKGYTGIRASFRIKADPQDLPRIRELAAFSPVFNTLVQGTPVNVHVEPMMA
ncbi:MAG TPA: OsmC family protein [Burkholderiaceae bacterium]